MQELLIKKSQLNTAKNYLLMASAQHIATDFIDPNLIINQDNQEIIIPSNTKLDKPIIILNSPDLKSNLKPINKKIILNANSKVKLIDFYFTNITNTEFILKEQADLAYTVIAAHPEPMQDLNQKLNITVQLLGEKASCVIKALTINKQTETTDLNLIINHLVPNCTSEVLVRSLATDQAVTNLLGNIIVNTQAKHSVANLQHNSLLLSNQAEIISQPQLTIQTDTVKCSHGSTTGYLDPAALFYLRCRGLTLAAARQLLISGFISPIIDTIPCVVLKEYIENNIYTFSCNT